MNRLMVNRISRLTEPLPSALYWDASFVVNFAYDAAKYFRDCADLLTLLDAGQTVCCVSTLTIDEACFILIQLKVEEEHHPDKFWKAYNADASVIEPYISEVQELVEWIYSHPRIKLVGTDPLFAIDFLAHMQTFHFLPRDAYHLATMRHYGINSIVTLDADFLVVPYLQIYTCNPSILNQAFHP